jgi:aminopeptidase YwaD
MALARWFGARPEKPKRSLIFMCFSGEELGLLGSDYYAKHPIIPIEKTAAMVNMDMIGRLRENKLIVIGSGTAKEWDALLTDANRSAGFTLARSDDGFGASDQQSFYSKNVPVLFFFTGSLSDYHNSTDTADKINAEGEVKVLTMVAACTETIANAPTRPTFQKINVPTPGGSPGFRVYFGSIPDYAAQVEGVQLNGVREKSPAAKAGLKAGDIIVKFGKTTVKGIQDYTLALQDYTPGDEVDIIVKRGVETLTLHAKLAARPE